MSIAKTTPPPYPGSESQTGEPSAPFRTSFASVSLHTGDRLRLLNFPPSLTTTVRSTLAAHWPRGIQSETPNYHGAHEFKLRGYPWYGQFEESVLSRRLLSRVLAALHDAGWLLTVVTDVSKKLADLDTLVFRHAPGAAPPPCDWLCVHFSMGDRLKLVDAPADLTQAVVALAARSAMLQSHKPYANAGGAAYEVKMQGYPWRASGGESMAARQFVLGMLGVLEEQGWSIYASIDQKAQQGENKGDLDTWHCCRKKDWAPGLPVYHR